MKEIKLFLKSFNEGIDVYKKINFKGKKLIPITIIILLFLSYKLLGNIFTNFLVDLLKNHFKIGIFTDKFIHIAIKIFIFIIYFYTYKFLVFGILSPFLSVLSEKTENYYLEKEYTFSFMQNIKFIFRAIGISFINFAIEMTFTIFFFFLGIFLPFKLVFYFLTLIIQGFFIGYSFMDFTLERRELGIKESIRKTSKDFVSISLMGIIFLLFFNIPIIGIIYGPFYFTIVGTLYSIEKLEIKENL